LCDISNLAIIEEIRRLKPKRVIIFAAWLNHNIDWRHDERIDEIRAAVKRIRETVDDVVILGPAPYWGNAGLPTAVFRFWGANKSLPERIHPVPTGCRDVDAVLAAIAVEQGARFISVFDGLCNEDGCLTHTPSSKSDLLSWDYGHLTTSGAHFLLELLQLN
jgi:hypothetical protein